MNPSGGELIIYGEGAQHGSTVCSDVRARRYIQQVCCGFLAYVMDTQEDGKRALEDMPIVREFPNVFPEDFTRVPLERQVVFLLI